MQKMQWRQWCRLFHVILEVFPKTLQLPQWLNRKAIHKPSFVPETSKDECFFLIMAPRPEKFMRDISLGKKVCKNISIFQLDNTSSHAEYQTTNYYLPLHMILKKNLIPVWRSFSNLIFPFCLLNTLFGFLGRYRNDILYSIIKVVKYRSEEEI